MNENRISPDEPNLTAYALGQLEGPEREKVEQALRHDPEARAVVEQTRAFAGQLEEALAHEPDLEPAGLAVAATTPPAGRKIEKIDGQSEYDRKRPKLLQFPQLYYVIGSLAAACVAVVIALHRRTEAYEIRYVEVLLNPPKAAPEAAGKPAATAGANVVKPSTTAVAAEPKPAPGTVTEERAKTEESAVAREPSPVVASTTNLVAGSRFSEVGGQIQNSVGAPNPFAPPQTSVGSTTAPGSAIGSVPDEKPGLLDQAKKGRGFPIVSGTAPVTSDITSAAPAARGALSRIASTTSSTVAFTSSGGNVLYYPPDDKFVVHAEPKPPALVADYIRPIPMPSTQAPVFTGNGLVADSKAGRAAQIRISQGPIPTAGYLGVASITPAPRDRWNTEGYASLNESGFVGAGQVPFSTFSVDVDTASYSNIRRFIEGGRLPPPGAVRIEELLNYFSYHYAAPTNAAAVQTAPAGSSIQVVDQGDRSREGAPAAAASPAAETPFAASIEVAEAPWAPTHRLVRIGLKGREVTTPGRPPANLVFLLDVSGSMGVPNKLPLVKESMRLLIDQLRPDDRIAIVTYAGESGLALPSTPVAKARDIVAAIDELSASGSTNGGMGIQLAYDVAKANFVPGGINRVILCTDGDFNVGITSQSELTRLIEEKAKSGVALTVLGFGMGNYQDSTLELLADKGNGNYGYVDNRREAEKLLVQQVNATLVTIAKDVKVQVDFNPARVAKYRLIGYEDRTLQAQDFNNDRVSAGEIGAGHAVTALYEIVPTGVRDDTAPVPPIDASKYVATGAKYAVDTAFANELLTVKVRYKDPAGDESKRLEFPLTDTGEKFADASPDFKFAAAIAGFGMILRDSPYRGTATMGDVVAWAAAGAAKPADDPGGYRAEFIGLARRAQQLMR